MRVRWWVVVDQTTASLIANADLQTESEASLPTPPPGQIRQADVPAYEPLESLIELKRIGAWRKIGTLYPLLSHESLKSNCQIAAAHLVEGFLAVGSRKLDSYMRARAALCRLIVELQFTGGDQQVIRSCYDALNAVQHLIIRYAGQKPNRHKAEQTGQHA